MMRKVTAIIQARMGSTRLPKKVLMPLRNKSVLEHVLTQIAFTKTIDKVVVATTDLPEDDAICHLLRGIGYDSFRGSKDDVLDRYYQCAKAFEGDVIVRITADCPFIDPHIVDSVVNRFLTASECAYASNIEPPTFPDGLDVEVFSFEALSKSWNEAALSSEREHVTQYMRKHPELFKQIVIAAPDNLAHLRWTLDTAEDYTFLTEVASYIPEDHFPVLYEEILSVLAQHQEGNSKLRSNGHLTRNEGLIHSLKFDTIVKAPHAKIK